MQTLKICYDREFQKEKNYENLFVNRPDINTLNFLPLELTGAI